MPTSQQLINKAAMRLGVLAAGQTLAGPQNAMLERAYASRYDRLLHEGLVTWARSGEIPEAFADPVAAMLAFDVADEFGVPDSRYMRLQNANMIAWEDIRRLSALNYVPEGKVVDY